MPAHMFHQVSEIRFGYFLTLLLLRYTFLNSNAGADRSAQTENRRQNRPCLFPSVHQRVAIYECQNSRISPPTETYHSINPIWWCPLTDNFDHYPEWRVCPETPTTYGGNHPGHVCHFPFVYQGKLQQTCLRSGGSLHFDSVSGPLPRDTGKSGYWWCATTENFDRDRQWTRCRPYQAHQLPCHFGQPARRGTYPVVGGLVGGITDECQPFSGHWVCRTEVEQLRECPSVAEIDFDHQTEGGNHPGFQCHFPFQATLPLPKYGIKWIGPSEKRNFSTCLPSTAGIVGDTSQSEQEMKIYPYWIGYWCATTDNFDRDRLWTRCGVQISTGTGTSLAAIWSHLGWFKQLSDWERRRLQSTTDGLAYNLDFQTILSSLERQRMLFEQNKYSREAGNSQLSWWTWLAPLWWASYLANHTEPVGDYQQELRLQRVLDAKKSDPLSEAFHLPHWVKDWSPGGWRSFGLTMRQRWVHMKSLLDQKTTRNWLVAYATGLATALFLFLAFVLVTCACIDRKRRNDAIRLFCGPLRNKTGRWSGCNHSTSLNRKCWSSELTTTLQPYHPSRHCHTEEELHCRHSKSIDSETCTPSGDGEDPRKMDIFFECENRNLEFVPFIDSEETKYSRSLNIEANSLLQHEPSCAHRGYRLLELSNPHQKHCSLCFGVCRSSECVYHKQQLDQLLKIIFSLLRRNHGDNYYNGQIQRLCSQLREQLRVSVEQPPRVWCPTEDADQFQNQSGCPSLTCTSSLCGQLHCQTCGPMDRRVPPQHQSGVTVSSCSPGVEPTAPPPSYEQFEKENSQPLG